MFNFLKKRIDTENIKDFQDVVKVTNFYISEKKWEKAHFLLKEAILSERKNANSEISKLDKKDVKNFETYEIKILKNLNQNIEQIKNLEVELSQNESKFKFIPESIKRYEDAVKSIKILILIKEWEKAKEVIREIKKAEKNWLDKLLTALQNGWDELSTESEKRKQLKIFTKKEEQLEKLSYKINNYETKYNERINIERSKIRFKKIKWDIELLTKTWRNEQALNILKYFLKENNSDFFVIKFYNKERKQILKNIEMKRKKEEEKIRKNIKLEAQILVWETIKLDTVDTSKDKIEYTLFDRIKKSFDVYNKIKDKIRKKKLIDEVTLLIEENENVNNELATKKLENIHKGLTKELKDNSMLWYDLYWKILWTHKISGDTFWLDESNNKYNLYIWDATWQWIKSWLIITLLTRLFNKFVKNKNLQELTFEINNWLKQDLKSRNFITGILFEIKKEEIDKVNYVWMWHEAMLVYRKETGKVEKIYPWWLAAWIRMIKDKNNIKVKYITLVHWDIILVFSDWTIESKNSEWESFWVDRLIDSFKESCILEKKSNKIYDKLINKIFEFRWWTSFDDDNTLILLKRDKDSDLQEKDSIFLKTLSQKEKIWEKDMKRLNWKNKVQIEEEINVIKKEKELKLIILNLKRLFQIWEFIKLKQEVIRHIKEWRVDKSINFYLKKALENETKYKIELKNKKIANRYNVLYQIYKKWDYNTVIRELENIIAKDWEI